MRAMWSLVAGRRRGLTEAGEDLGKVLQAAAGLLEC